MRRSLLFIPSNHPGMLQNADIFDADGVIFDLEDSVLIEEKDAARHLLLEYLKVFQSTSHEVIVRINGIESPYFGEDLNMILSQQVDTIMFPKATVSHLEKLIQFLDKHYKKQHNTKKIGIIPIIESAQSVIEINQIAKLPYINGLLLGGEDLATDLGVERTEESMELFYARSRVIYAAKANRLDAIDTPYTDTTNLDGLTKDASTAKMFGMNAKACIHPNQIETVNTVFSPSQKEILYAKKVMALYDIAQKEKKGAFSVDGKMIDQPIIERCKRILEHAKQWGLL